MGIKAEDIAIVDEIFSSKGWDVTQPLFSVAYDNTLKVLDELDGAEKQLFIDLLKEFKRYGGNLYEKLLLEAAAKIPPEKLKEFKKIIFVPLKYPLNQIKAKSCDQFPFTMRTAVVPYIEAFRGIQANCLNSALELKDIKDDTLIIALDDFIGSGRTIINFYNEIKNRVSSPQEQIIFLALVKMSAAERYLRNKGIVAYSAVDEQKCISENPKFTSPKATLQILKSISTRLRKNICYYRGHYKSEALLAMMNTPNNTLPIFWSDQRSDRSEWPAPFKRAR